MVASGNASLPGELQGGEALASLSSRRDKSSSERRED